MTRRSPSFLLVAPVLCLALLVASGGGEAGDVRVRQPPRFPDVPGFLTLQCDFHVHTVFSDGSVWPDVRSEEAWREGYDAIAITDHIEYQPHRADLPTNHERAWEIAAPLGEKLGIVVIHGSEVTRKMPPGHLNALFLKASTPLATPEWRDALRAARDQGAFLFWNHPGWRGQQKDGVARWYREHTEILEAGLLDGIEVFNDREYYPEAHLWALEKDLAMLADSDVHDPVNLAWDVHRGDPRPVTLVFARERSEKGIREALFARRTAAFSGETLVGREELLSPLVAASLAIENPRLAVRAGDDGYLRVRNDSGLRLALAGPDCVRGLSLPKDVVLAANGTSLVEIAVPKGFAPGPLRLELPYTVTNVKVAPGRGLAHTLVVDLEVLPAGP